MKDEHLNIRMDAKTKRAIEKLAKKAIRKPSEWARMELEKIVAQQTKKK